MTDLITLVFVLIGILQLILLVKIWVMTNDIRKIKKIVANEKTRVDEKASILIGEKDSVIYNKKKEFFTELTTKVDNYNYTIEKDYNGIYKSLIIKYKELEPYINFKNYDTLDKFKEATTL